MHAHTFRRRDERRQPEIRPAPFAQEVHRHDDRDGKARQAADNGTAEAREREVERLTCGQPSFQDLGRPVGQLLLKRLEALAHRAGLIGKRRAGRDESPFAAGTSRTMRALATVVVAIVFLALALWVAVWLAIKLL